MPFMFENIIISAVITLVAYQKALAANPKAGCKKQLAKLLHG